MKLSINLKMDKSTFIFSIIIAVLVFLLILASFNFTLIDVKVYNTTRKEVPIYPIGHWGEWKEWKWTKYDIPENKEINLPDFKNCTKVICECAKNTDTPCMALCLSCK